jgi:hypothetical protein
LGSVTAADIELMLRLYDRFFFEGTLWRRIEGRISFAFSNRMTKTAGRVAYNRRKRTYRLTLSYPLIVRTYAKEGMAFDVNGVRCTGPLDAMMCVLEHEMVHLVEFELFGSSSCGKRRFKAIAGNLFGHTGTKHSLGVTEERKRAALRIPLGSKVRFEHGGKTYTGTLARVTKRATVVLDRTCGCRYEKFYVPLEKLSVAV